MVNRSLKQDPVFESPRVRKEEGGQILTLKPTVMEAGGGGTGGRELQVLPGTKAS